MRVPIGILSSYSMALVLVLSPAAASDLFEMTDERGDVIWRGFVTRQVDGYGEIDIVSLTSSAALQDVTVELTLRNDVSDELGYIYSISASGINIAYTEGEFQVWRWENGMIEIDNVQTGVSGKVITCVLPRTALSGSLVLNATAQYYIPSGLMTSSENYYDGAGEFGDGTRAPSIGDLDLQFQDPAGDVEMSYYDERTVSEGSVDILFFSADLKEDLSFSVSMEDDIVVDGTVDYSFIGAGIEVLYMGGDNAYIVEDGSIEEEVPEVEISGANLHITIPGSETGDSLGAVFAAVRMDQEDQGYSLDMVPNDPYTYNDLLPFPAGDRELLSIMVHGPEEVVMVREYSGFSPREAEDISSMLDEDGDGTITQLEVDLFFTPSSDVSLVENHQDDIRLDGRTGSLSISLATEGILGSTQSAKEVRFTWELVFTFDPPDRDLYDIELNEPQDPFKGSSLYPRTEEDTSLRLVIELNSSWRFDPFTLEPSQISNYMGPEASIIDMEMDPVESYRFDPDDIGFGFYERGDDDGDGVPREDDDGGPLWLYIIILVGMVAVIVVIYLWSKRGEID